MPARKALYLRLTASSPQTEGHETRLCLRGGFVSATGGLPPRVPHARCPVYACAEALYLRPERHRTRAGPFEPVYACAEALYLRRGTRTRAHAPPAAVYACAEALYLRPEAEARNARLLPSMPARRLCICDGHPTELPMAAGQPSMPARRLRICDSSVRSWTASRPSRRLCLRGGFVSATS